MQAINDAALEQLFSGDGARSHNAWQQKDVSDSVLHKLVELVNLGPTSVNCEPARFVFVKSAEEKERLLPMLSSGNRVKTQQAPVCAIIGYDLKFYEQLPRLFPHKDMRPLFTGAPDKIEESAFRNGTLQGGYFILAARLLGLDVGPMSGFDHAAVDASYFAGTDIKANFLCNLGYGEPSALMQRLPRLPFDDCAKIV